MHCTAWCAPLLFLCGLFVRERTDPRGRERENIGGTQKELWSKGKRGFDPFLKVVLGVRFVKPGLERKWDIEDCCLHLV